MFPKKNFEFLNIFFEGDILEVSFWNFYENFF